MQQDIVLKRKRFSQITFLLRGGIVCIILAVLIACFYLIPGGKMETNNYTASDFRLQGLKLQKDGSYITTNVDPQMSVNFKKSIYVQDICITFGQAVHSEWDLQVFYADNADIFTEERSMLISVNKNSDKVTIPLDKTVAKIRLDLGSKSKVPFYINTIEINKNDKASRYIAFGLLFILIFAVLYILFFMMVSYSGIAKKELLEKRLNKGQILFDIFAFSIYILIFFLVISDSNNLQKDSFWKEELTPATINAVNDLSGKYFNYTIAGNDSYIVYDINEGTYNRGIVYFNRKVSNDTRLGIYYTSKTEWFSEENKTTCTVVKDTDYAVFSLPSNYKISSLRVDYEGENGIEDIQGRKFCIESLYTVKSGDILADIHGFLNIRILQKLLLLTILFSIIYFAVYKQNNFWNNYYAHIKLRTTIEVSLIFILPVILMWKYLSGQMCFIFSDVGNDSYFQFYPYALHTADRMRNGQWMDLFSFLEGLGNKESFLFPNLDNWISLFGRGHVAYLFGLSVYLKMALSGLFACIWFFWTIWY